MNFKGEIAALLSRALSRTMDLEVRTFGHVTPTVADCDKQATVVGLLLTTLDDGGRFLLITLRVQPCVQRNGRDARGRACGCVCVCVCVCVWLPAAGVRNHVNIVYVVYCLTH